MGRLDKVKSVGGKKKPRSIMVRCNTVADRNLIWKMKAKLKNAEGQVYIQEDFPMEVQQNRAILYPIMKMAKSIKAYEEGTYLSYDKLVINKHRYSVNQLEELPIDLNPRLTSTQTIDNMTFFYSRNSPLSNHYIAPFIHGTKSYTCSEQAYFAAKAEYLNDEMGLTGVMAERDPRAVLEAGKKIVNRNNKDWAKMEVEAMTRANRAKFLYNPKARAVLLATGDSKLAECSPHDGHWGIKMDMSNPEKVQEGLWATNLMGQVLTFLRQEFQTKAPGNMLEA
jgi:ribA/ribD-fused uncharacterized protein